MRVSFGSWAFSFGPYSANPIPFEQIVRRLAAAGYDGVELCGFPPQITLEKYPTGASRAQLRRMIEDLGLGISGFSPDLTDTCPVTDGGETRYLDEFARNVALCADIGSPMIRVDTSAAPGSLTDADYRESGRRLASTWRKATEIAAQSGLNLAWEFEPAFIYNKPSEIVNLYEKVGHPSFQILFDTCHAYLCSVVGARQEGEHETVEGGLPVFLDLLSGRIGHVHLVDTDGTLLGDETSRHLPLGKGVIDFEALAPKLRAVPGVEWWCTDLAFVPGGWGMLEESLAFVKRLLAGSERPRDRNSVAE